MNGKPESIILLISAAVILLFFCTLQLPGDGSLVGEIQNTAHTVVFGLLALVMLGLSRSVLGKLIGGELRHYIFAFAMAVFVGALNEFIQIFGLRDADIWDLVRDMAGAGSFLGLYATVERRVAPGLAYPMKIALRAAATAVLLASLAPLGVRTAAFIHRDAAFPRLLTFDAVWESAFLTTRNARLERVPPPDRFAEASEGRVGRLTVFPGEYCGFRIAEPYPDWSDYRRLGFDVYNRLDSTITLTVRIDDSRHNQEYEDRYNGAFGIPHGSSRIWIDLEDVRNGPSARELIMTDIRYLYIFTSNRGEPVILYFDNVELVD